MSRFSPISCVSQMRASEVILLVEEKAVRIFRTQHKTPYLVLAGVGLGLAGLAYGTTIRGNLGRCATALPLCLSGAESQPLLPHDPVSPAEARARVKAVYGRLPLSFEENRGQTDSQVRFLSRGEGYRLFVTATETVLVLRQPSPLTPGPAENATRTDTTRPTAGDSPSPTVLTMKLMGANPGAPTAGFEKLPGKVNYFIGNDPALWHTDVPTYARVETTDVYPGVDMVHRGNQRQLEYDFVVAPGADPGDIRISFGGRQKVFLDSGGDLVLTTPAGEIRQHKPYIYQEKAGVKQAIAGGYLLKKNNEVGFEVGPYDASLPLVLDPVLAYSTYLGGTLNDDGRGIAVDAAGNGYVAGVTSSSTTFPRVGGIPMAVGGLEAFVSKLNAAGDSLIYSTFLGGEQSESANAIAVDDSGQAYVTGYTRSPNFPTTAGGYQRVISTGNFGAFVTRLNAAGNALLYSTFLGGSTASTVGAVAQQEGLGIAVDSASHAYLTGLTNTVNFPQLNGYQGSNGGQIDAFVTKLNTNAIGAASLVYSTYLGGGGVDHGVGIAIDGTGHAYVTGRTDSGAATAPFPTLNPIQGTLAGGIDAFVAKVDTMVSGAASLVYSTYLGGSGNENQFTPWPGSIAVDSLGYVYVTGGTNSWSSSLTPFPTTASAYQPTSLGVGDFDAFLTEFNPAGTAIVYSTFFGGTGNDIGRGVAVDSAGHAYVTGETSSGDLPIRSAVQPTFAGGPLDAFVAKIDTGASGDASLGYSTYFGGAGTDIGFGIALDSSGNAYATGKTSSTGLATAGSYQASLRGAYDAFVAKIEETPVVSLVSLTLNPTSVTGGVASKATVALSNPAPAGGVVITLASSDTSVATVPATTRIAEGRTTATVTVATKAATAATTVDISATYDGVTKTRTLTVVAPALKSLTLSPTSFTGGCEQSVGKVTLTGKAPSGGVVVSLSDTNPVATVPASVTVPMGMLSATFIVTAPAVSSNQTGTVTASLDGISRSKALTVRPIGVQFLSLAPNPVVGPNGVTGTVTLQCKAAPGDIVVTLSSTKPAVAAPTASSITIPFDSTAGSFTVTTADVSVVSSTVIKATAGGLTKSVVLTVNP
jgi:beta-propeller repeat-containing protein